MSSIGFDEAVADEGLFGDVYSFSRKKFQGQENLKS